MTTTGFRATHDGCGGEVTLEDNGACGDPDCYGDVAYHMEYRKCGARTFIEAYRRG